MSKSYEACQETPITFCTIKSQPEHTQEELAMIQRFAPGEISGNLERKRYGKNIAISERTYLYYDF